MTETTVNLRNASLIGVSDAVAFTESFPVNPASADRLAAVNSATQRVVMVARNTDTGAPMIADISPVIVPAPTTLVVNGAYLITMADRTVSKLGQLRKYLSFALDVPLITVDDADASGPLVMINGDEPVLVHGRGPAGTLAIRDAGSLDLITTVTLPSPAKLLTVSGNTVYVYCEGENEVRGFDWDPIKRRFDLHWLFPVPGASYATAALFDGIQLLTLSREHISVVLVEDGSVRLNHHDVNAVFSSMDTAGATTSADSIDGLTDPEYITALWNARFNPGKDREHRDYYRSAEQLSKLIMVVGTDQSPTDPVTSRLSQPLVRRVGERWMVIESVTGRISLSGDLVWRFRGGNVAEKPRARGYSEPDAATGVLVSNETAIKSRMAWTAGVDWKKIDETEARFAYLNGKTDATFGSVKTVFLPLVATFAFWIRPEVPPSNTGVLLGQNFDFIGTRWLGINKNSTLSSIVYNGAPMNCTDLFDGDWHHVALVLKGESAGDIYVDGLLVGTLMPSKTWTPDLDPLNSAGQTLTLGRRPGNTPDYYKGWLGDCRIYKLAASAGFIQDLYDRGPLGIGGAISITTSSILLEDGGLLLLETGYRLLEG